MAAVTQLEALIPVKFFSGADYGAEAIQIALKANGYYATVVPQIAAHKLKVTLKLPHTSEKDKDGVWVYPPFDLDKAKSDIATAASGWGTTLSAFKDWAVTTVAWVAETQHDLRPDVVLGTAGGWWEKKFNDPRGVLEAFGIPTWVPWVVGGVAGLYVLNSLVAAKKTFLGGAPGGNEQHWHYIESYKGQRIYISRDRRRYSTPLLRDESFTNLTNMRRAITRGVPAHLKPTSDAENEVAEMKHMLATAGYNPADVVKLTRDGIGPEELRSRIAAGSLENTHRIRRSR